MKVVIIDYSRAGSNGHRSQPERILSEWTRILPALEGIRDIDVHLLRRGQRNARHKQKTITVHQVRDEFGDELRWCDNPHELHILAGALEPDFVHIYNLGLPLHFRWLRHQLPEKSKLIGHHTGETIWIQLRLFLQQFGLRAGNGYIFKKLQDAEPWLKASVILPNQPVIEISDTATANMKAEKLSDYYKLISNS